MSFVFQAARAKTANANMTSVPKVKVRIDATLSIMYPAPTTNTAISANVTASNGAKAAPTEFHVSINADMPTSLPASDLGQETAQHEQPAATASGVRDRASATAESFRTMQECQCRYC